MLYDAMAGQTAFSAFSPPMLPWQYMVHEAPCTTACQVASQWLVLIQHDWMTNNMLASDPAPPLADTIHLPSSRFACYASQRAQQPSSSWLAIMHWGSRSAGQLPPAQLRTGVPHPT